MQKKLTITIDEHVYAGLHSVIGPRKISGFIEQLVRPYVTDEDLAAGYAAQAADEADEAEALEWLEGTAGDVGDEPW
ncbi:MAG: addiction module antitoxin [Pyrinomonadaceae bacterium]